LTILDLDGHPLTSRLDLDEIFTAFRRDPTKPKRLPFVAAKDPALAAQVVSLIRAK
jgi:hypothetical protein